MITPKAAKKIQSFSIDDENFPYKGVKGKGIATVVEDPNRTVPEAKMHTRTKQKSVTRVGNQKCNLSLSTTISYKHG